ncbi:MAG TPA: SusC/RagA family TonB-linked outer membrane protein [Draconibacterium sp.]|nr:SusC/RagA family TonB-linked outer membrane protein [Draconibacterium sp.]
MMKLTMLLFFAGFMQVSATVYSQATKFNFIAENKQVVDVLKEIEESSNFRFFYIREQVGVERQVTVKANGATVEQILDKLFDDQGISYKVMDDNLVLLSPDKSITTIEKLSSQQKSVSGKVTDESGQPLPGVTVLIKGTTNGSVTNIDGVFTISNIPENATLVFSFIGMRTQEVTVAGQTTINITMGVDAIGIEEVVAIGYGSQKKSDLTGAVVSVSNEDMNMGGTVSSAAQALQGRTAGVVVTQNSKAPGGSISVRIRGSNSISSNNEPLYVVDGFPTSNGSDINPNDIESMQILKDASATAIYGARGANGVILITTKRGKAGESEITYSGYVGTQKIVNPFDMLDGKQYMNLANALYKEIDGQENAENAVYTESQLQSNINTDWIKETSRTGVVQDHNIQFKGGSEKTKVLASLGYFDQKGVMKNTDFSRLSGRINIDQTVNDYVKAGATVFAQRENSNFQLYSGNILNQNVLLGILNYDPTVPAYNEDGTYGRPPGGRGDNPLANLLERINDSTKDKFNGNLYLEIEPLKNLVFRVNGGAELTHSFVGTYLPRSTYQGGIDNGVASRNEFSSLNQLLDATLSYKKIINEDHSLNVMGGYSYQKYGYQNENIGVKGFSTDLFSYNNVGAASTITSVSSYKRESLLVSFFGRFNYAFRDKYLATFTLRGDGSSRFGSDQRWGTFPSGSLAWRLDQEEFIKDLDVFSNLKLRLGYGKTGNDQVGEYASYALMSNTHLTFDGSTNTAGTHLNPNTPENPTLKWETTSQYNVGLDMGFFNSRLAVSVDAYSKSTYDLLIRKNLPTYSGFFVVQSNVGEISNKGFEIELNSINTTGEFKWETRFNFALNRNKVVSLGGESEIYITSSKPVGNVSEEQYAVIREGEPLGSLFGYVYDGVLQEGETYAPQPNSKPGDPKYLDLSGPEGIPDGKITSADRTIIGSAQPDFFFGFTNNFDYKNFDLSLFFYGSVGNDLLNMNRMNLEWNRTTEALNRWTPSNTNTDQPRNGFYYAQYGGYTNSHFVEDASFLRLKNITLGYTIPSSVNFLSSLRIYVVAENVFTLTKYTGWDPEVDTKGYEAKGSQTANAGGGLDFNSYPSMKAFTVGLNVTF